MSRKQKKQTATTGAASVSLNRHQQEKILRLVQHRRDKFNWSEVRERMLKVDKAMQLEDQTDRPARKKEYGYYADTRPPLVKPEVDSAHAYFADIFASGDPIFKVVENNQNAEQAKQMQAQVTGDEMHFRYSPHISKFLKDGVKYNIHALEVDWVQEEIFDPTAALSFGQDSEESISLFKGNSLRRIDPYNMFWDTTVPPTEVAERGAYAGYIERMPLNQLHEMLRSYRAQGKVVLNENADMWNSMPDTQQYYVPDVVPENTNDDGGWGNFWGFENDVVSGKNGVSYSEHYEVVTMYMRIIPSMLGINVANKHRVQIWKFKIVNWTRIVLAERATNVHNLLPMRINQMDDESIWSDAKSMAELLVPYQNQSTDMHDAYLGLIWKAVGDKGIYDARRIRKADMESNNPTAKIPARPTANNNDLRGAYLPLTYDGNAGSIIQSGLSTLRGYTSELSGQNNASRGQFQKGNKTMYEYQDVMSNSDAKRYIQALSLEANVFQPIKNIIKLNILQYTEAHARTDAAGEKVAINPAEMREAYLQFRIADGLKSAERLAKTGEIPQLLQLMAPYAQMAPAYGIDPFMIILDYIRGRGLDISNYTPANFKPEYLPRGGAANGQTTDEQSGEPTG